MPQFLCFSFFVIFPLLPFYIHIAIIFPFIINFYVIYFFAHFPFYFTISFNIS